ncbi:S-adenosyl-L-methionine-dependent methyltransferase, partial [Ochromonadaceae sp. CCMP2298]
HFYVAEIPEGVIMAVCERAVLVKAVYELWGRGDCLEGVAAQVQAQPLLLPHLHSNQTWALHVNSFGHSMSMGEKQTTRDFFNFLEIGPVDVKKPQLELWVTLDYTPYCCRAPKQRPKIWLSGETATAAAAVAGGAGAAGVAGAEGYIGPTSLDHSLALIMANLTHVRRNSLVLDPFVGTASILVALAHFGALCYGTDIDVRVLKGEMHAGQPPDQITATAARRGIFNNFLAYGLPLPELIRMDNSLFDRHGYFDCIVTDPPYGIRAGAKKSGQIMPVTNPVAADRRHDHIPRVQRYEVEEVMLDLLHTAARCLVVGGRLSYLIP